MCETENHESSCLTEPKFYPLGELARERERETWNQILLIRRVGKREKETEREREGIMHINIRKRKRERQKERKREREATVCIDDE